jgi:hypothetical protein
MDDGGDMASEERHEKGALGGHGSRFLVFDWDSDDGQDGEEFICA